VKVTKSSGNVFEDLGFDDAEAALLKEKSELVVALQKAVERANLSQAKAAEKIGMSRATLNRLFRGNLDSVSMDRLITAAYAVGVERTTKHRIRTRKAAA